MSIFFRLLKRVVALPFVVALLFVSFNFAFLQNTILYIMYGGEWLSFYKEDKGSIRDLLNIVKK